MLLPGVGVHAQGLTRTAVARTYRSCYTGGLTVRWGGRGRGGSVIFLCEKAIIKSASFFRNEMIIGGSTLIIA